MNKNKTYIPGIEIMKEAGFQFEEKPMGTIERLKELEAKATKGPWLDVKPLIRIHVSPHTAHNIPHEWGSFGDIDSQLIKEMRNHLPQILDLLEAAWDVAFTSSHVQLEGGLERAKALDALDEP